MTTRMVVLAAVAAVALACAVPAGAAASVVASWGSAGSSPGELSGPRGLDVYYTEFTPADGGNPHDVWVADTGNDRVQRFSTAGQLLSQFGVSGAEPGQLDGPADVAVYGGPYGQQRVLVADTLNNRIQRFRTDGTYIDDFGSAGSGPGEFDRPVALALAGDHLYVVDAGNHRVQKFMLDGQFVTEWGTPADMGAPTDVLALQGSPLGDVAGYRPDDVYVVDSATHRVGRFEVSDRLVGFRGYIGGGPGSGDGQFSQPSGIGLASRLFVADAANLRLQQLTTDGTFAAPVADLAGSFSGESLTLDAYRDTTGNLMPIPGGSVTLSDHVFVVDPGANRIHHLALNDTTRSWPPIDCPVDPSQCQTATDARPSSRVRGWPRPVLYRNQPSRVVGTASDDYGVSVVHLSIVRKRDAHCQALTDGRRWQRYPLTGRRCKPRFLLRTSPMSSKPNPYRRWSLPIGRQLRPGRYRITSRATDTKRQLENSFSRELGNVRVLRVTP